MSEFIRIRSWHIVGVSTRVPGRYVTLCGRRASGTISTVLRAGRSCESCLRNAEWLREAEDDGSTQPTETVP